MEHVAFFMNDSRLSQVRNNIFQMDYFSYLIHHLKIRFNLQFFPHKFNNSYVLSKHRKQLLE